MKIVIKRGSHMGGPLGEAPRSEADKLFIYFYLKKDGLELGQGFIVDFEKVRNLLPGGEIKG